MAEEREVCIVQRIHTHARTLTHSDDFTTAAATTTTDLCLCLGHKAEDDEECDGQQVEDEGAEEWNGGEGYRQGSHHHQEDGARSQDGRRH